MEIVDDFAVSLSLSLAPGIEFFLAPEYSHNVDCGIIFPKNIEGWKRKLSCPTLPGCA
jgi:hypothetical protein